MSCRSVNSPSKSSVTGLPRVESRHGGSAAPLFRRPAGRRLLNRGHHPLSQRACGGAHLRADRHSRRTRGVGRPGHQRTRSRAGSRQHGGVHPRGNRRSRDSGASEEPQPAHLRLRRHAPLRYLAARTAGRQHHRQSAALDTRPVPDRGSRGWSRVPDGLRVPDPAGVRGAPASPCGGIAAQEPDRTGRHPRLGAPGHLLEEQGGRLPWLQRGLRQGGRPDRFCGDRGRGCRSHRVAGPGPSLSRLRRRCRGQQPTQTPHHRIVSDTGRGQTLGGQAQTPPSPTRRARCTGCSASTRTSPSGGRRRRDGSNFLEQLQQSAKMESSGGWPGAWLTTSTTCSPVLGNVELAQSDRHWYPATATTISARCRRRPKAPLRSPANCSPSRASR